MRTSGRVASLALKLARELGRVLLVWASVAALGAFAVWVLGCSCVAAMQERLERARQRK